MVDSTNQVTEMPLEDCMDAIIDYRGKTPKKTDKGIPLVTAKIIKGGRIEEPAEFIAPADYDTWMRRGIPEQGDVVLTTEAPLGEVAQLDDRKVALAQRVITLRGKAGLLDNTFLKYLLISEPIQARLKSRASGTTVLGIKQSELRKVKLTFPPLPEQRAIASILGALDDKIELNRRMNATLESLARAIFKSWFVDFDPVKINAGQMPASSQALATHDPKVLDLFPSTFQDSELGPIPEGWSVESLSNLAEVVMGTSPKSSTYNEHGEGAPLVNGPVEFGEYFPVKRKWTTAPTRFSEPNDLIFCVRGSTTGRRIHSDGVYCLGRGVCAIRSLNEHQAFINQTVEFELQRMLSRVTGSVFPNLSAPQIKGFKIIAASDSVLTEFSRYVDPIKTQMAANVLESAALSSHRDALLPQLLSGELPVPAAMTATEEALV